MAREHANIQIDIWNDPDFRELSASAQLLYIQLLSSATLTYAGVADWRPKRIAVLSKGRTPADVVAAMKELVTGLFIVVDEDTEEALVRSYFKWDGLMLKPNVAKAMVKAWAKVHSLTIKAVIVHELRRLSLQFPEWRAFEVEEVRQLCEKDSINPAELVSRRVSERVPERDASLPTTNYLLPTTSNIQHSTSEFFELDTMKPEHVAMLDLLDSLIEANGSKKPTRNKKNIDAVRLMVERDGRTLQDIEGAIRWSQNDEFWRGNILSMSKLREQFDKLRLAAQRQQKEPHKQPSRSDEAVDFIQRLEAIDATRGGGEAAGDYPQLRQ